MSDARRYSFIVLFLVMALYIAPLGVRPMFVPDESRYAEVPREMIASGDWVSPHLDGLRYFEKPALGYWVTAASIMVFGENNFAIRLPSALSVALTAFFIFSIVAGCEAKKDETSAPLAALVFLTSLEVYAVGTFCVLDSLLSCFITGTMAGFYLASIAAPGSRQEKKYLLLTGIFCGLAFLTKGFLAFAVPILAIVPYLLSQRRFADILRMAWLPLLTAILVALPWSILIHLREPEFWHYFFWNEHVHRFLANNAQHRESPWYFFLIAPPMFLPWTFLVPAAVTGLFSKKGAAGTGKRSISPLISFCICWFIFPFLFFSVSNGKLLTYILPCFPPMAILMSLGLHRVLNKGRFRSFQLGTIGAALLYSALLAAIIALLIATQLFEFNIS
ncbi:MAG: phospholipid carrier-dependent glycosyltransferase [Desulfobulbaceae bacterium]|nr:phospholipid carrier-dependent glycosyltransferase [Desulfobulbaceae bacterium]